MEENNNNLNNTLRGAASRAKRGGGGSSRAGSHRTRTSRLNPGPNLGRNPTYLDDLTLNAMITSGMMEALGPVHFAQFRVPLRDPIDLHQNELGSGHFDYRFTLIPNNPNMPISSNPGKWRAKIWPVIKSSFFFNQSSDLDDVFLILLGTAGKTWWGKEFHNLDTLGMKGKENISKLKSEVKDSLAELLQDEPVPQRDHRFLLPTLSMEEVEREDIRTKRQETIMQWFDRSVEKELSKKRTSHVGERLPQFSETKPLAKDLKYPQSIFDKMAEASASQIEITADLAMEPDTELTDAVEKFAKAEAMCAFAGAVKAAEAAAEAAPPGMAEEAALASARIFESEIASEFRQDIPGLRPMEVIGYIGVTKPKNPVKSEMR